MRTEPNRTTATCRTIQCKRGSEELLYRRVTGAVPPPGCSRPSSCSARLGPVRLGWAGPGPAGSAPLWKFWNLLRLCRILFLQLCSAAVFRLAALDVSVRFQSATRRKGSGNGSCFRLRCQTQAAMRNDGQKNKTSHLKFLLQHLQLELEFSKN